MSFLNEAWLGDKFGPFVTFQEGFGFVPNLLHAQTLLPRGIEAQAKLENAVRLQEGAISRVQKERILLSIAGDRQDMYCMALDSKVLSSLGVSERQIDDLLNDCHHAGLSVRDLALLQFCLTLSRHATSVRLEDIEALRTCGFDDESILEAVLVTALAIYRSTLSLGLGPEPDFGLRELAPTRIDSAREGAPRDLLHDEHGVAQRKGPYVPAPYLSSQDAFRAFRRRSEESRIRPELFPRSDFAARLAGSGVGSDGQNSAT